MVITFSVPTREASSIEVGTDKNTARARPERSTRNRAVADRSPRRGNLRVGTRARSRLSNSSSQPKYTVLLGTNHKNGCVETGCISDGGRKTPSRNVVASCLVRLGHARGVFFFPPTVYSDSRDAGRSIRFVPIDGTDVVRYFYAVDLFRIQVESLSNGNGGLSVIRENTANSAFSLSENIVMH